MGFVAFTNCLLVFVVIATWGSVLDNWFCLALSLCFVFGVYCFCLLLFGFVLRCSCLLGLHNLLQFCSFIYGVLMGFRCLCVCDLRGLF